jgi:Helix-turn-helix domain
MLEEYLTPAEVAEILKVSLNTVIRRFENVPGVIDLGSTENMHKRRYRTLRIPRSVLNRFVAENRVA